MQAISTLTKQVSLVVSFLETVMTSCGLFSLYGHELNQLVLVMMWIFPIVPIPSKKNCWGTVKVISISRGDTNTSLGGRETPFHCTEGKLEGFQSMSAQYALKVQKQYKTKGINSWSHEALGRQNKFY